MRHLRLAEAVSVHTREQQQAAHTHPKESRPLVPQARSVLASLCMPGLTGPATLASFGLVAFTFLIELLVMGCGAFADDDPSLATCDPVSQTGCDDPTKPKCSIMPGTTQRRTTGCGPAGTVAEGQACTRTSPGVDDCANGACVSIGQPDGELACRRFCRADGDCLPGQSCLYNDRFEFAACTPTCSSPETCPAPAVCHALVYDIATTPTRELPLLVCASVGTNSPGAACSRDSDCQATSVCDPSLHCAQLCNAKDTCGELTCTSIGNGLNLCR